MNLWVGITDEDWYRHLRSIPDLDEANFWQPSGGRAFRALEPGEPFLFKLHSPRNFVVGGGFFLRHVAMQVSVAWEAFGARNGAASYAEMRRRIAKYRRQPDAGQDYVIGNILLTRPFFFAPDEWIPVPEDWAPSIQQGKRYDLRQGAGDALWQEVRLRLSPDLGWSELAESPMYGDPILVAPRLGQGSFKLILTDTYQRRCAVTGEKALPTLDAAHIRGVAEGGRHDLQNGLLLRADVHRLFDRGYVTVTPDLQFRVSRKLREDFDDGEPYLPFDRQEIWTPADPALQPGREFLEWHTDTRFRG